MPIDFQCACGKSLKAPDDAGGKRARCPKCKAVATIPYPNANEDLDFAEVTATTSTAQPHQTSTSPAAVATRHPDAPSVASSTYSPHLAIYAQNLAKQPAGWRRFTYAILLLALIPLAISTFHPKDTDDVGNRLALTVDHHPEIKDQVEAVVQKIATEDATQEDLFTILPNHQIEGALLARDSKAHWLICLGAAGAYSLVLMLLFTGARKYFKGLLIAGFFTGTIGIILLLGLQWAAYSAPMTLRGGGKLGIILLLIKLVGLSYTLAESDVGFFLSFVGFTCGVGLCEEVTKALPILFRIKPIPGEEEPSWTCLLLWGLASGIGFGIAEGIMYSRRHYNGLLGTDIYFVRFMSCVVLHAIWAGAIGVTIYNRQEWLQGAENNWVYSFRVVQIVLIPMILHGLYDTLLKQDHEAWALIVALLSFGWLAFQIERMRRREPEALAAT